MKAMEAERGKNGGKVVWKCIRDIQRGRRGLVPVTTAVVKDEDGNTCNTPEMQQQRWRRHFTKILNLDGWRDTCRSGMERHTEVQVTQSSAAAREVECEVCSRKFRRESDKKRHKCLSERNKPVSEQRGAAQCQTCRKWFGSRGGLAVHTCRPPESGSPPRE